MRSAIFTIVAGIELSVSIAAYAAESLVSAPLQMASLNGDSPKIVCHYMSHEGEFVGKPVCATRYTWDNERRRMEQVIANYQLRSLQAPSAEVV